MALSSGAHVSIGGTEYLLDEGYEAITGRRCYVHGGRSIFAEQFAIAGQPGRSVRQDRLVWYSTNFNGEGQVVLDSTDELSPGLFYRSEGLDFRTPGQAKLNKSTLAQTVTVSAAGASTDEGNSFTDITGTSTSSGTDRKLNAVGDKIASPTNFGPGATTSVATFYVFRESFSDYATTIQGSSFNGGITTGSDKIIHTTVRVKSANITSFTAFQNQRVECFLFMNPGSAVGTPTLKAKVAIMDVTSPDNPLEVAAKYPYVSDSSSPTNAKVVLNFVAKSASKIYQVWVVWSGGYVGFDRPAKDTDLRLDRIVYGEEISNNQVTIEVYNQTGSVTVKTKKYQVTSTAAGKIIGTISWDAVAATNYRFRLTRSSGRQKVWLDKVTFQALANAVYQLDCLDFGVSQKVWLGASTAAADSKGFVYNTSTNAWDDTVTFNDAAATVGADVIAMAHSDSLEYFLLDSDEVYTSTSGGVDDRYAYFSANTRQLRGMTVCQNRVLVLGEDSTGVRIYSVPLDDTSTNPWNLNSAALSAGVTYVDIAAGNKSPDTTLRQRMTSSPTGGRFFINYSDTTAKVYQVDTSGATLSYNELADLGIGVKATCIAYEGGITFIGGLFYGDPGTAGSTTDVDKLARPALWAIDQNGVLQRIGFFRRNDPAAGPPVFLVPYQTDLYTLQSGIDAAGTKHGYVWRYSLVTGGLFCEYELPSDTTGNQRSMAISPGRAFALYSDEIFTTGSDGTFRVASAVDGNSWVSSIYDAGFPTALKTLVKVDLLTDTMPSNTSISLEYQTDQSGTWTLLGTAFTGTRSTFNVDATTYTTLQLRVTLASLDGVSSPVFRAAVVESRATEDEEYFDLVLLTEDADSGYRVVGDQQLGNTKAQNLVDLWRAGTPTTFVDGYITGVSGEADAYQVTVGDLRDERTKLGEGRVVATLKVIR